MRQQEHPPEEALLETIESSDLGGLAAGIGEFTVDLLLNEEILRDFPIVSSLVSIARAGISIRDHLFLKKLWRFLSCLKDCSEQERLRFMNRLGEQGFRQKIGESLVLLLDRMDDMQKPELLGRVFRAYLQGKIDHRTFQGLATAVDRIKMYTIPDLVEFYSIPGDEGSREQRFYDLALCGLAWIPLAVGAKAGAPPIHYRKNELGKLFMEVALDISIESV